MDIVQFIRRVRVHGLALTVLLNHKTRNFLARAVKQLPLTVEKQDEKPLKNWNKLEHLFFS